MESYIGGAKTVVVRAGDGERERDDQRHGKLFSPSTRVCVFPFFISFFFSSARFPSSLGHFSFPFFPCEQEQEEKPPPFIVKKVGREAFTFWRDPRLLFFFLLSSLNHGRAFKSLLPSPPPLSLSLSLFHFGVSSKHWIRRAPGAATGASPTAAQPHSYVVSLGTRAENFERLFLLFFLGGRKEGEGVKEEKGEEGLDF